MFIIKKEIYLVCFNIKEYNWGLRLKYVNEFFFIVSCCKLKYDILIIYVFFIVVLIIIIIILWLSNVYDYNCLFLKL